ncbi:uncharacterized protein TRIADDRAFT_62671 [Trichoplax adhaerens]|uniref:Uncharacterized protein n=1 Tax=Trichoplax adhaerens TaxID=10228 RepID=B3SEI0_TRIAD|nr:predicted protein [Trichoplax adhaerens]EDV18865.1 predicted protein [Trichoplax adhaerens]|eukprot:XP_002118649.1 predicted protein [Trichoplax adhaerens]
MPNFASGLVQVSLILLSRPPRCFKKISRVPFAYPTLIKADPFIFGALKSRRYTVHFLSFEGGEESEIVEILVGPEAREDRGQESLQNIRRLEERFELNFEFFSARTLCFSGKLLRSTMRVEFVNFTNSLLGVAYVVFSDVVVKAFVEPVDENNWNRRLDGNAINDTAQLFVIGFRNCLNSSGELFLERHKVVADYG